MAAEHAAEEERLEQIEQAREEGKRAAEVELLSVHERPVDDDLEAAFEAVDMVKAVFTVFATNEELEQVEIYLNSIGVEYKRS